MKIDIMLLNMGAPKHTDVRTVVDIDGKIYSEGTGISTPSPKTKPLSLELEILESVKRHIITIQENILAERARCNGQTKKTT